MTAALARLERVQLRDVWLSESADFTPWLASPPNIKLLADTIGLDLEVEAQEKNVGPFRADILCKETTSNAWVLIENQLERTDHTHLGQLMTYAAGLEVAVLVWIAERFTEEHRAALDWLNELGSERLRCFGLEIELWKIGNSPVAPKFNVVCKPNDWSRTIAASASHLELTETLQLQHDYWKAFVAYLESKGSPLKPQTPKPQNWMNIALGRTGVYLSAIASTWSEQHGYGMGENRVQVTIDHPQYAKSYFAQLESDRDLIEKELGEPLAWNNPTAKKTCTLALRRTSSLEDREDWPSQFEWLRQKLERLATVFTPRVKALAMVDGVQETMPG